MFFARLSLRAPRGGTLRTKNVYIFCVSRELLEGIVVDRNAAFMATRISDLGFRVRSIQVVDNVEEDMVHAFQAAMAQKPAFIITTGGMGPAFDDITRNCVAKAAGVALKSDERGMEMLSNSYRRLYAKGIVEDPAVNERRARMALVPEGSICHENPIGTAPAVRLKTGETTFFLLPGVPAEMQRMFGLYVHPALTAEGPGVVKEARHIDYYGRDESAISRLLEDLSRRHHGILSRARVQGTEEDINIRITLFGEHSDAEALDKALDDAEADLRARLGLEIRNSDAEAGGE